MVFVLSQTASWPRLLKWTPMSLFKNVETLNSQGRWLLATPPLTQLLRIDPWLAAILLFVGSFSNVLAASSRVSWFSLGNHKKKKNKKLIRLTQFVTRCCYMGDSAHTLYSHTHLSDQLTYLPTCDLTGLVGRVLPAKVLNHSPEFHGGSRLFKTQTTKIE